MAVGLPFTSTSGRPRVPVAKLESGIPFVPVFDGEDQIDASKEAATFLQRFSKAVSDRDWDAMSQLLYDETAWWRDSLSLTFDRRTIRGKDAIVQAWREMVPLKDPKDFVLDEAKTYSLAPAWVRMAPQFATLDVPFAFNTDNPPMANMALAKLVPVHHEGKLEFKLWLFRTAAVSLIGHDFEALSRQRPSVITSAQRGKSLAQGLPMLSEGILDAVVVGGSMSGIANAIMLDSAGANIAVFESEPCVGHNWTTRYSGATLHHSTQMVQLPQFPVPEKGDYARYLPGTQITKYCCAAVESLRLPVFAGVRVANTTFDEDTRLWSVRIADVKTDAQATLKARNLVLATGHVVNSDNISKPISENASLYKGPIEHTAEYRTAAPYKNKNVVIVGSGTSAHDVAKDLANNGAASVTILQRSPTALFDFEDIAELAEAPWRTTKAPEAGDMIGQLLPAAVARDMMAGALAMKVQARKDRFDALESKGYMVDRNINFMSKALDERGRSFFFDQPRVFDLVFQDRIRIARGEAKGFTENGLVVRDIDTGEEKVMPAEGVVLATGYKDFDLPKFYVDTGFMDEESAAKLENVGLAGVDVEGELPGIATCSGHPNLYFASFGLLYARVVSRQVALQVMADVTGQKIARYPRT